MRYELTLTNGSKHLLKTNEQIPKLLGEDFWARPVWLLVESGKYIRTDKVIIVELFDNVN